MRLFQRAGWLLLRFVGSYVGLAILPLAIIVASMSVIATTQADRILFRFISYPGSTFEVLDNADYSGRRDVRSSVIRFQDGVADQVREAVTTFGGSISAVSHRIVEEAKREEAARTAAGSSSAFSLSADSQRASSAVALSGAAVQSAMGGASVAAAPASVLPPGAVAVAMVTPAASTPTLPPASPPATPAPALSVAATTTSTPVRTATVSVPAPAPASGAATSTPVPPPPPMLPATNAAPAPTDTPVPAVAAPTLPVVSTPTLPVVATTPSPPATLAPTQTAQSSATAVPPSPTARETATAVPPTLTPLAPTATPGSLAAGNAGATATATLIPTSTAQPTATVPEMALDLSVPGGSSLNLQPIFSGDLSMRAGESTVRTVSVQNNGTRPFRYSLNTSGGDGPLWNDSANGLQMSVVRNGSEVYRGPLRMPDQVIGQLSRGGQDTLVITVWLPATADNSFQGLSTTIAYNFTAVAVLSGP